MFTWRQILPRIPGLILLLASSSASNWLVAHPLPAQHSDPGMVHASAHLDVALTVKENAGVGASDYPISVVIPLPQGQYTTTANLGMAGVPSQVEVLERWLQDDSLRHVQVHFQPSVGANGNASFHFGDAGAIAPVRPVVVMETVSGITVTTGPIRFTVGKTVFNILDQVWFDQNANEIYESSEQIISSNNHNGGVFVPRAGAGPTQYDTARSDLKVVIEERGPMRAVIRVESLTQFVTTTQHTHGFAVRIYAYSGKSFIKMDYQLQNSAKNAVRSWPLYFDEMNVDFALNLAPNPTVTFGVNNAVSPMQAGTGVYLAQEMHNRFKIQNSPTSTVLYDSGVLPDGTGPEGFIDVSDAAHGVTAVIRNFWQMWPNGLKIDGQNRLSLQLFPGWSAQWQDGQLSASSLYWLEDMQHVYKEILLSFHGPNPAGSDLIQLARTFQYYPVAVIPIDWYRLSQATLDLGGIIPPHGTIPSTPDQRQPVYDTEWYSSTGPNYGASWVNFGDPEHGYRAEACTPGGWPYSASPFIATGNPSDYFVSEAQGMGELNVRPEWMAQYNHDADWSLLQLSENGYCNGRWRIFAGNEFSKLTAPPLPGTGADAPAHYARDDQHGWFYHVAESYFLTGNPWVKDWYQFIAEFRRVRLDRLDPYPDYSSRATGHTLNQVIQAYRVTGDASLLVRLGHHIVNYLRLEQDPYYGDQSSDVEPSGGGFQTGYLMRAIVDFLEEVRDSDWQAYAEGFNYLSGLMEWNYHYGNFPYYFDARSGGVSESSGTGLTLVDPQAWYYWHTGKQKYLDQIDTYMTVGINGGEQPYGEFSQWTGQYEARYYPYVKNTTRSDITPPPPITNLSAITISAGVLLQWTAPVDAVRYHVVWSNKPIVENNTTNPGLTNWWAANVIGLALAPVAGTQQSLTIPVTGTSAVYAAIFSFDQMDNMSAMSNLAVPLGSYQVRMPLVLR